MGEPLFYMMPGITIRQVSNGGYVMEQIGQLGCAPVVIGAYRNGRELLEELAPFVLMPSDKLTVFGSDRQ